MEINEQEDCIQLKKNFLIKEHEWKKDRALYEQKIQLLELQLEDYKTREINQKKLNDTITQAIDISGKTQQKSYSEFQKSMEIQFTNNKKYQECVTKLEEKLRCINEQLNDKENQLKDLEILQQKQQIMNEHKIQTLEQDKQYLNQEVSTLKDQLQKIEENYKSKEQLLKLQCEQEIQKIKDTSFKDMQEKQSDYDQRYQQLAQLYEKEKDQLQQRLIKSQNTIKKYQDHIESNQENQQMQQKYQDEIAELKQQIQEQQIQFQQERNMLKKQIEDQINIQNNCDTNSKKKSVEVVKLRNSIISQDSPIQCKSIHIVQPDNKQSQTKIQQTSFNKSNEKQKQQIFKNNLSFEKIKPNNQDTIPMSIDEYNNKITKKSKSQSQSTNSIPQNNNINQYLQEACIFKEEIENGDELIKHKMSHQLTSRYNNEIEQIRSYSQQGINKIPLQSAANLSKMLGQHDYCNLKQVTQLSTQQKTHNTSFSHFKVPAFTQSQLNNLKHSLYQQPWTTLRNNDSHTNHIQSIKARYNGQEDSIQNDSNTTKNNKENQDPPKSVHINNEIKFLIGKLLQAKGRLQSELENTQKSCRFRT
ncbi:unnamed protein product [Paramecium primaurelia]|uniref:Uncharacterized protein n=1 Tax=Paramecium primaurelia TaxID=5886 RepID=A0A8S1MFH2_PARPR|nr:unnamed protein product [Paramecium primaurelia]